jgi:uncharacterized membrane protein
MSDRLSRLTLCAIALAGGAIAAYLTIVHYRGGAPICVTGGCETVQRSRYAEVLGLPVAALGLAAFAALLGSTATRRRELLAAAAAVGLAGAVFAAYLVVVQSVVIRAICPWCVAADMLASAAAALALVRLRASLQ